MKKKLRNNRFKLLAISLFLAVFSCDKESTDEIITQEIFDAPSIESARQFVNSNNNTTNTNVNYQKSTSNLTSVAYWEGSKTKKYKETEQQNVDILYTPIYLKTTFNAKAFLASTEYNGHVDSRKIYILYRTSDLSNGLSALIFIYKLDGSLQYVYNFEDGQSVPIPQDNGTILNKNGGENCNDNPAFLSDVDFENWLALCGQGIDLSVVDLGTLPLSNDSANNGGSTSAFNDWNSNNWVSTPALLYPGSNYNNGNINGNNTPWHTPNVTVANAPSIAAVMDAAYSSLIANWLRQMELTNQQILNQIAAYLNANRVENPNSDFTFGNIQPEQFPVSNEAIQYVNDLINFLDGNPELNSGGGMSQQEFNDLENCFESNVDSNFDECFEELYSEQFIRGMDKDCQALAIFRSISKTKGNSDFTQKIWNHFFKNSSTNHINIQDEPLPGNTGALVGLELVSDNGYDDVVIMQFDNTYLDTATTLGFVNTFYHELVHAYIVNLYHNGTLLTEYPNYTDLKTSMDNLFTDTNNTAFKEAYKQESHNIYTDFIDDLAEAIVAYSSYANISGVDLTYAKKLVWGGLNGNNVFTENLTITERLEAQTLLAYENSNTGAKKGTKTCN